MKDKIFTYFVILGSGLITMVIVMLLIQVFVPMGVELESLIKIAYLFYGGLAGYLLGLLTAMIAFHRRTPPGKILALCGITLIATLLFFVSIQFAITINPFYWLLSPVVYILLMPLVGLLFPVSSHKSKN